MYVEEYFDSSICVYSRSSWNLPPVVLVPNPNSRSYIPVRWFRLYCLASDLSEEWEAPPPSKKKQKTKKNTRYDCHGIMWLCPYHENHGLGNYLSAIERESERGRKLYLRANTYIWASDVLVVCCLYTPNRRAVVSAANDDTGCWRPDQALMAHLPFPYYLCQEFYALYIQC